MLLTGAQVLFKSASRPPSLQWSSAAHLQLVYTTVNRSCEEELTRQGNTRPLVAPARRDRTLGSNQLELGPGSLEVVHKLVEARQAELHVLVLEPARASHC